MKVIPVIDILNDVVVHAVRGRRSEYQPLQSILTQSTNPAEVAKALKTMGFSELYIADLDAIIDCSTNFQPLKQIAAQTGLKIMADAGVTSLGRARNLLENGVWKLIVGTETLQNKTFVAEAVGEFGGDRVVLSLDLRGGSVLVGKGFDGCTDALCLIGEFKAMGLRQVIVLDLARVGSGEGVDTEFLRKVLALGLEVYVGGGVRDIKDLIELRSIGVSGALVATSLHNGKISVADLKQNGFL